MIAKDYLSKLETLHDLINYKLNEITQLKDICYKITNTLNENKVQTTPKHNNVSSAISKYVDLELEIKEEINTFVNEKHKIINQIQSIKKVKHMKVLYEKYVCFKTLQEIAIEWNVSYVHVRKLHSEALSEFEKIIEKGED